MSVPASTEALVSAPELGPALFRRAADAGDEMTVVGRETEPVPVAAITRLYLAKRFSDEDARQVRRALEVEAVPESWKGWFREKLNRLEF